MGVLWNFFVTFEYKKVSKHTYTPPHTHYMSGHRDSHTKRTLFEDEAIERQRKSES